MIVFLGRQTEGSPFLRVSSRVRVLVEASHSDQVPLLYLQAEMNTTYYLKNQFNPKYCECLDFKIFQVE